MSKCTCLIRSCVRTRTRHPHNQIHARTQTRTYLVTLCQGDVLDHVDVEGDNEAEHGAQECVVLLVQE